MLEKPAQKLLVAERHHTALAVMSIILPPKRHVSVGHLYQSMVGDRTQRDGCSEPDNATHVLARQMAFSHRPPNPHGIACAEKQRMLSPALVAGRAQRRQAYPGGKRVSILPRTFREIRGSRP